MRQRFGAEITSGFSNNKLNRGYMTSHSTNGFLGSESDGAVKWSELCT